jgi:hypothetical protein
VLLEQKVRSKNEIKILNYIKTFKKNNKWNCEKKTVISACDTISY